MPNRYALLAAASTLIACGHSEFNIVEATDGSSDVASGDTSGSGDSMSGDGPSKDAPSDVPTDGPPVDAPPPDTGPTCDPPKTLCGALCTDLMTDSANCGACGTPCTAPDTCVAGKCAPPKCKSTAPNVLFYGPCGSMEKAFLPPGSTSTVANDSTWRGMTTADFAKYDIVVIGAPDLSVSSSSTPTAAILLAAYDTRAVWGAAIKGRIVVLGLDPAYHADKGNAGATTFQKASLNWLATGAPGTTALYVNSDWGARKLDFMSPFGSFSSGFATSNTITVTSAGSTHPIMVGSTSSSLSSWGNSGHSTVTFPTDFTLLATGTTSGGETVNVAVAKDQGRCAP